MSLVMNYNFLNLFILNAFLYYYLLCCITMKIVIGKSNLYDYMTNTRLFVIYIESNTIDLLRN